jgi:ribosomal protein S20
LARTPRKWTGARSPGGLKRVRSSARRHEVLGPRRTAAKTLVKNAISIATAPVAGDDPQVALAEALSALDRAAKSGAIHANAAARRKSRLTRKVTALVGGTATTAAGRAKQVGRAAAQKAAKARIAAGKAGKAKGAQTAAGKARAALSRTSRAESADAAARASAASTAPTTEVKAPAKAAAAKAGSAKAPAKKAAAKTAAKTSAKPAAKAASKKPAAKKS